MCLFCQVQFRTMAKVFRFLSGHGSQLQVDTEHSDGYGGTVCPHWSSVYYNLYQLFFISPLEFFLFIAQTYQAMKSSNKLVLVAN